MGCTHSFRVGACKSLPAIIKKEICIYLGELSSHYLIHITNSSLDNHHIAWKYGYQSLELGNFTAQGTKNLHNYYVFLPKKFNTNT